MKQQKKKGLPDNAGEQILLFSTTCQGIHMENALLRYEPGPLRNAPVS